jgi:hypothetical protein
MLTGLQTIQLLVQTLGSNPNSWFHNLGQPLGAMTGSVDAGARTGMAPLRYRALIRFIIVDFVSCREYAVFGFPLLL